MYPRLLKRVLAAIGIFLVLVFVCGASALSWVMCHEKIGLDTLVFPSVDLVPKREWAIVFGAKVWGNRPSTMLEDRLQTALELQKSGKVARILVTGGPSENGPHEALLMAQWLQDQGVPKDVLSLDFEGLSTFSSLSNAREDFAIHSAILISQEFHLSRALYVAKNRGLDAVGLIADRRVYEDRYFASFRELLAFIKALCEVRFAELQNISLLWSWLTANASKEAALAEGRQRIRQAFLLHGQAYPPRRVTLVYMKTEKMLDVYVHTSESETEDQPVHLKSYPILAASGTLGPKLREGDHQVPEGIYRITFLNYKSRFHLSLRLDYPNEFDRQKAFADQRDTLGSDIMIHGKASSAGCLAVGDTAIEELFALASDSDFKNWKVILAPFDLTGSNPLLLEASAKFPVWYPQLLDQIRQSLNPLRASKNKVR